MNAPFCILMEKAAMEALSKGAFAGYAIAIPVGAIAILIIDMALRRGFQAGFFAGAGAASADLIYASLAAIAGHVLASWLAPLALPLQIASGIVLIGLGGYGLWGIRKRSQASIDPDAAGQSMARVYQQFLGLTLLNPATVAYFASLILGGGAVLNSAIDRVLFVIGAVAASLSWQTTLAVFGSMAGKRLPARVQLATSIVGNLMVAGLGIASLIRAAASG
jgi:threonine/homoserine/homoserine lactone efflux protein